MDIEPLAVAGVVAAILIFIQPFNDIAMLAASILAVVVGGVLCAFS